MPSNHITLGAYSLEHKERYDIIIGEGWYIFVVRITTAELGRNSVSKHQIQHGYGDEQADAGRDG